MKCRHAKDSELDKVCDLLAEEFSNDPLHEVLFTEPKERIRILRNYFRIYVDLASKRGGTLFAENDAGVLVYFRPEVMEMSDEDQVTIDNQIREVCGSYSATVAAYTQGLKHYHPRTPPHYYILLIAIRRSSRGGRVVTDLFSALHAMADKEKFPCYAECTKFSTRTNLRRWGYLDAGPPLRIDGFPELFPVWRESQ